MPHQCTDCGRTFADGSKQMLSGCPDCGGNKFQFLPAGAVDSGPETEASADAPGAAGSPAGRPAGGTAPKKTPEDSARSARSKASSSRSSAGTGSDAAAGDASAGPETEGDDAGAMGRAAATVRDWVRSGGSDDRDESGTDRTQNAPEDRRPDSGRNAPGDRNAPEDTAQASARSDVVSEAELPDAPTGDSTESPTPDSPGTPAEPPRDGEVVDTPNDESPGLKELREELNSQFESIRIVEPGQYELNLMELYEREEYIIALKEDGKYVIEVPDRWESPD